MGGTKLEPNWNQAVTKLEPRWNQAEPSWNESGTKLEPSWNQAGTKLEPSKNQMEPAWNQAGTKVEPSWYQAGAKLKPTSSTTTTNLLRTRHYAIDVIRGMCSPSQILAAVHHNLMKAARSMCLTKGWCRATR